MMTRSPIGEVIRFKGHFYILASSSLTDSRTQVLKSGESFAVFSRTGDIEPIGQQVQGIYHEGTRFLSRLELKLLGERPMLLSSSVKEDNMLLAVDLTNTDIVAGGNVVLPRGTLHLSREKFLWKAICYERIAITNYSLSPVSASLSLQLGSDFADLFEIRGMQRKRRGRFLESELADSELVLVYEGLDRVVRRTRVRFSPQPSHASSDELRFEFALEPDANEFIFLSVACEPEPVGPTRALPFDTAFERAEDALDANRSGLCDLHTSNEQFNDWINRASADLRTLVTETPQGPYPYAGVPWFSTAFGRDGIITALETLWIEPALALGVLKYLAATQATESDPQADAEPGKILHETRKGEMVALKEVPFARYYGSADATPLFVMLAAAYFERTADRNLIEEIWPNIDSALRWIDQYGDVDGDGFVEYTRRSANGLENQGWKDSRDSVFHADGRLAEAPIALCEVQGYVYEALHGAANLAQALGRRDYGSVLRTKAEAIREKFENAFWCDEIGTYALALDGQKAPCQVRTSNPGHCLFTGIASAEHARRTTETLLQNDMFTGWGIRTLSSQAPRYNPMSYHDGSVWPHDNALAARGMARYGFGEAVARVFTGLFDAAIFLDQHRMPELFCGFLRRPGEGPTLYPVACLPQAWSAASVFLLIAACLGISITAAPPQVRITRAFLPESVQQVEIRNLRVAEASVDLSISRFNEHVAVNILRREGKVEVISTQ